MHWHKETEFKFGGFVPFSLKNAVVIPGETPKLGRRLISHRRSCLFSKRARSSRNGWMVEDGNAGFY